MQWKRLVERIAITFGLAVNGVAGYQEVADVAALVVAGTSIPWTLLLVFGSSLVVGGGAVAVAPSIWARWRKRGAGYKFRQQYRFIARVRDDCAAQLQLGLPPELYLFSAIAELEEALRQLQIPHPVVRSDDRNYAARWYNFLARLAPLARAGDVQRARALMGIPDETV